jgi:hypothetical protein
MARHFMFQDLQKVAAINCLSALVADVEMIRLVARFAANANADILGAPHSPISTTTRASLVGSA